LTFSEDLLLLSEQENNFIWTLEKLKGVFFTYNVFFKVIVSDKDSFGKCYRHYLS